jgi:hypothetical protein
MSTSLNEIWLGRERLDLDEEDTLVSYEFIFSIKAYTPLTTSVASD